MNKRKTVLDIGNCGPDHSAIERTLQSHFNVRVLQAQGSADAVLLLDKEPIDLILINRKLDIDYSDGMDVLKLIKADSRFSSIPAMLVSNFAEVQEEAIRHGARPGFGKLSLSSRETIERLSEVLSD